MNDIKLKSGDSLVNVTNKESWKVIMVDEEHNQAIISHSDYGYRVVNIKGLDIDYILNNGE